MNDYLANKESILYKDRLDFGFLLDKNNSEWFSSGAWGLFKLSEILIACYTAERKLNCLNDLISFIDSKQDRIMEIHGETIKDLKEYFRDDYGVYFCIVTIYNLEGEMQNELKDSIERFLKIINLEEYFAPWIFKYTKRSDLYDRRPNIRNECFDQKYRKLENCIKNAKNEQDLSINIMYKVVFKYGLPIDID